MLKYKVEGPPSSGNRGDLRGRWLTGADGVVGAGDGGDRASGAVGAGWARGGRRVEPGQPRDGRVARGPEGLAVPDEVADREGEHEVVALAAMEEELHGRGEVIHQSAVVGGLGVAFSAEQPRGGRVVVHSKLASLLA